MDCLEPRLTPAAVLVPDFDYPLYNASFSRDYTAFGAGDGGGPRVEVFHGGQRVLNVFAFEDTQRGGASVSLVDVDGDHDLDLLVAAGARGGPVVVTYRNDGGEFHEVGREFIGDPGFRGGVYLGEGQARLGYAEGHEYVLSPDDVLKATVYPGSGADPTQVNENLDRIPVPLQARLVAAGKTVYVYHDHGRGVTELPEFAHLRGQLTAAGGDGDRTWDQVPAAATFAAVYIPDNQTWPTIHEVGHLTETLVSPTTHAKWVDLWSTQRWSTDYEADNENEAWAESFVRAVGGGGGNSAQVNAILRDALGVP